MNFEDRAMEINLKNREKIYSGGNEWSFRDFSGRIKQSDIEVIEISEERENGIEKNFLKT